jgi:hypothetical protein
MMSIERIKIMPTVRGKYSSNSLDKDKVTEMDPRRTKACTVDDGKSYANIVDLNSAGADESNHGLTSSIKRGGK